MQLQLIDSNGSVIQTVKTNNKGFYKFKIYAAGDYVVRQVTPSGFIQTTPDLHQRRLPRARSIPAPNSWSYATGNNNPANGAVGPYAWDTIAPAGNLPFESPINLTGAPTDLSSVLKINYNNSVPTDITNSAGHQFQVQYPTTNTSDTITVNGVTSNLVNFHYHDPSEHTVNGGGYPLEEHFVNVSPTRSRVGPRRLPPARPAQRCARPDPDRDPGSRRVELQDGPPGRQLRRTAADEHAGLVLRGLADDSTAVADGELVRLLDAHHARLRPAPAIRGGRQGRWLPAQQPAGTAHRRPSVQRDRLRRELPERRSPTP